MTSVMYDWGSEYESGSRKYLNLIIFCSAAAISILVFLALHPHIEQINKESPIIINLMFIPVFGIGFLYGLKMTESAIRPSEVRSPIRRAIMKIFLFFFVIGGMFSAVSFAMNGGSSVPILSIFEVGLIEWATDFVTANGGTTFLIISSITIMAAATRRIVQIDGFFNKVFTFVGTFIFFMMIAMSFTNSDPTNSEVYLYAFYQAGIIGGALFQMNRMTQNMNMWEDFQNGYW